MDKEELVDARGGWTPGKLEYKPLFAFPPKPVELLKWLFNYPDGFILQVLLKGNTLISVILETKS